MVVTGANQPLVTRHSLYTCIHVFVAAFCVTSVHSRLNTEPNPPQWPSTVRVFSPTDTDIADVVSAAYRQNGGHNPPNNGQFSDARFAFMFKPGTYNVDVPVGFYTTIHGLGANPGEVIFSGQNGVFCEEGDYDFQGGALDTFWRSAENFQHSGSASWMGNQGMLWAVSQAAPLRRIVVDGNLSLYEYEPPYQGAGYSSGGFIANAQIKGKVLAGSQQQFFARNVDVGEWVGGVWNIVTVGSSGGIYNSSCNPEWVPGPYPGAVTNVPETPSIAEKPFISISSDGKYTLNVPPVRPKSQGPDWSAGKAIDFANVYVGSNTTDTAATLNAKLTAGLNVVLAPGIYSLEAALKLNSQDQVLLGLGMATLISTSGNAVIEVGDVSGVRVAGFLLQAGPMKTATLLQWGQNQTSYGGDPSNPGILSDVFARVGGPEDPSHDPQVTADVSFSISAGNVIIDNTWLWRADHNAGGSVMGGRNPSKHGLVVDGNNVTGYGIAVEHHLEDMLVWNGEDGAVYFYQAELPYDVTQESFGDKGFVGYRVTENVTRHVGAGLGVYHYFRDYQVTVQSGISVPPQVQGSIENAVGIFLNGKGTMMHVLNDCGGTTSPSEPAGGGAHVTYCCKDGPAPPPVAPTPPPPPKPPAGWSNIPCDGLPPPFLDEFQVVGKTLSGTVLGTTPGMQYCRDCIGRCFQQQAGKCIAVFFNVSSGTGPTSTGTCTSYSSVKSLGPGVPSNIVAIAGSKIPHTKA